MSRYISVIAVITLSPAILLCIAATLGGYWPLAPLLMLGLIGHAADEVIENIPDSPIEHSLKNILPLTIGLVHFALLGLAVWSLTFQPFGILSKFLLFTAFAMYFANVSNAVAHELIHRTKKPYFTLGKWIFISVLFGQHTSAHRLVHHPYVATRYDPNTAHFNENFYRFFFRAWKGSFLAGLGAENERLGYEPQSRAVDFKNPFFTYILGHALFLGLAGGLAGGIGLLIYIGLALLTQTGLLVTDYVQHYGLLRAEGEDGKFTPVAPHHSWNAPHWFTRNLTLNAPLHSDHHAKPTRPYTELQNHPAQIAPQLPYSPGVMSIIAFYPRRWKKIMNPRVADWAKQHPQG